MFLTASGEQRSNQRFSLLLLDEGEYYFEDFSVNYFPRLGEFSSPSERTAKVKGRLKLCSASLIFDPEEAKLPILKMPFRSIEYIDYANNSVAAGTGLTAKELFLVKTNNVLEMKEGNRNVPYKIRKKDEFFFFSLNYTVLSGVLANILVMYSITKLPPFEKNARLREMVEEREKKIQFDPSWLVDHNEKQLLEIAAVRVQPLVHNPGRLMLTNDRVYFQPMNNVSANPVEKFNVHSIKSVSKRRHNLRETGVEIFFENNNSVLFVFKTTAEREHFYKQVQHEVGVKDANELIATMKAWQEGQISNYDYLIFLNRMAGRSFNDLTQYPVFPWVIADYVSPTLDLNNSKTFRDLSKPIGALNPQRLNQFLERYEVMPDDQPKFLYGTHYSTPGYVLYYLVRQAPDFILRLQNGRFDAPDRMFHSIAEAWEGVLSSPTDVKELIPEFYTDGEFLLNFDSLVLGVRSTGSVMGDVILPPWASSHRDFISKCKQALECDYVSAHLHEWIDLIFGFKQQGEEARRNNNLFYYLTYEGAVDIEKVTDPVEKAAIEAQISEFGQTPKQLFKTPHPRRLPVENRGKGLAVIPLSLDDFDDSTIDGPIESLAALGIELPPLSFNDEPDNGRWRKSIFQLKPSPGFKIHKDIVTDMRLSNDGQLLYSVSKDTFLKVFSIPEKKQIRSISPCNSPLSACILDPNNDKNITVGSWDNNIYFYSIEYGRVLDTIFAHEDAVSCLQFSSNMLISGSWDSTVKVWKFTPTGYQKLAAATYVENEVMVMSVDINPEGNLAVSGAADGTIMFADLRERKVSNAKLHADSVNSIMFANNGRWVVSCSEDGNVRVLEFGGKELFNIKVEEPLRTMATDDHTLLIGGKGGSLRSWDLDTNREIELPFPKGSIINKVVGSYDAKIVAIGCEDSSIQLYQA